MEKTGEQAHMTPEAALAEYTKAGRETPRKKKIELALAATKDPYCAAAVLSLTQSLSLPREIRRKLEQAACRRPFAAGKMLKHGKKISRAGTIRAARLLIRSRDGTILLCGLYKKRFPAGVFKLVADRVLNDDVLLFMVYKYPDYFPEAIKKKSLSIARTRPDAAIQALSVYGTKLPRRVFRDAVDICLRNSYWAYYLRIRVKDLPFHVRRAAELAICDDARLAYKMRLKVKDILEPTRELADMRVLAADVQSFDKLRKVSEKAKKVRNLMRLGFSFQDAFDIINEGNE